MKNLNRLWQSLEAIPGLQAIPAFWELYCGPDIDIIRPHLRVTGAAGTLYPCPTPHAGHCPRRIVDYGDGHFAAICRDPHEVCERVELTQRDVLLQELDIASFTRSIAPAMGIRWQPPTARTEGVWALGLSSRRESPSWPVFLVIARSAQQFLSAVQATLLAVPGPFVLIAPTDRHRAVPAQELLQSRGIQFLALSQHLGTDETGHLAATAPEPPAAARPTTVADRRRVVNEFAARNHCTVKDIQAAAGVDESDYYKWIKGELPDHYSAAKSIERVLCEGSRAARNGERAARSLDSNAVRTVAEFAAVRTDGA